jgi:hypothetical protein
MLASEPKEVKRMRSGTLVATYKRTHGHWWIEVSGNMPYDLFEWPLFMTIFSLLPGAKKLAMWSEHRRVRTLH